MKSRNTPPSVLPEEQSDSAFSTTPNTASTSIQSRLLSSTFSSLPVESEMEAVIKNLLSEIEQTIRLTEIAKTMIKELMKSNSELQTEIDTLKKEKENMAQDGANEILFGQELKEQLKE